MNNPLRIQANVNAPIEKVWGFWTEPEHIKQWAFASDDWHVPAATNNVKIGGKFSTTMAAKDGSFSFEFGGEYIEVDDLHIIGYTMSDGRKSRIVFEPRPDHVQITQEFEAETENSREKQQAGWQAILNNFKKYVEQSN